MSFRCILRFGCGRQSKNAPPSPRDPGFLRKETICPSLYPLSAYGLLAGTLVTMRPISENTLSGAASDSLGGGFCSVGGGASTEGGAFWAGIGTLDCGDGGGNATRRGLSPARGVFSLSGDVLTLDGGGFYPGVGGLSSPNFNSLRKIAPFWHYGVGAGGSGGGVLANRAPSCSKSASRPATAPTALRKPY